MRRPATYSPTSATDENLMPAPLLRRACDIIRWRQASAPGVGCEGALEHAGGVELPGSAGLRSRGDVIPGDHGVITQSGTDHRIHAGVRIDDNLEESGALEAEELRDHLR